MSIWNQQGLEMICNPSGKCNDRNGYIPDIICCHQTGCPAEIFLQSLQDQAKKTAAHFVVTKSGVVYKYADIEKMVCANPTDKETPLRINHFSRALNPLVRNRKTNADYYTVSVFFENDRSGVLTYSQYDAGLRLFIDIITKLKKLYGLDFCTDREHLIGHYEVAPASAKNCPGIDFPFQCFLKDLK